MQSKKHFSRRENKEIAQRVQKYSILTSDYQISNHKPNPTQEKLIQVLNPKNTNI